MKQYMSIVMKLSLFGMLTIASVTACSISEPATPTVSPELIRLDMIESDVRATCDTYIKQSARGTGNAIDLTENIARAYADALSLFESMDTQSPHVDDVRRTLSRIATIQRHTETFEDEMVSLFERLLEDETATFDHWHTTSVELCASW